MDDGRERGAGDDYFVRLPEPAVPSLPPPPPPPRRQGVSAVAVGGLLTAVLAAVVGVVVLAGRGGAPAEAPTAADAPTAAPTAAAEIAGAGDGYAVWATHPDGRPVRWDPCRPIRWVFNPDGAPPGAHSDVVTAMSRVTQVTGLDFRFDGMVDEVPTRERAPYQPDRYGDEWAPVLVAWVSAARTDIPMAVGDRAAAVPVVVGDGEQRTFVTGQIVFNADRRLAVGFGDRHASWGATIVHEVAHIVGLDHVNDPAQLMYPFAGRGPVVFGDGDLAGLRAVGASGGCIDVPDARPVEVTYGDLSR
jgi:hypothetical protein